MNKGIVLGMVFLVIGMSFTGTSYSLSMSKSQTLGFDGNILYVGGSGEGNYTKIQDAIDDATDGDTVFVYDDSSPYQQSTYLSIEKSINLIGENRVTTIIDGSISRIDGSDYTDVLIYITNTDWVNISGFTFQNSERCGITTYIADNINISGNIFIDNGYASIAIIISNYSYISNNICTSTKVDNILKEGGMTLEFVSFTTIIGNTITNCLVGISLGQFFVDMPDNPNSNIISGNLFDNNDVAMEIRANNTIINRNTISNHNRLLNLIMPAISLEGCNNTITCNNFINNIRDAKNVQYIFSPKEIFKIRKNKNVWDGNYWGEPRSQPKFISSRLRYERGYPEPSIIIPWFNFDMNPAQEPYNITTTQGCGIE